VLSCKSAKGPGMDAGATGRRGYRIKKAAFVPPPSAAANLVPGPRHLHRSNPKEADKTGLTPLEYPR
jgi:hypothetical protein